MRTIRIFITLSLIILFQVPVKAQQTAYFSDIGKEVDIAKELFAKGKYISCFREFEKIQEGLDRKSELYSEAEYYKSVSALKAGYSSGQKLIRKFIDEYPDSPYNNRAWFETGRHQFSRKQYTAVIRSYANVNRNDLSEDERIELQYQNGYANLMAENNTKAATEFFAIKDKNNLYSKPATYYWAHLMYLEENYQSALEGFTKLNNDPVYSRVIPLYVSHIYYKQQKYNEVVSYTTSVIDDVEEEHKTELSKIIGDSYFHLKQFDKAIPYLETYFETPGPKTREENYILGYCYYSVSRFEEAIPLFEKASAGDDEMAQNAYYHLADCLIKTGDKENAKTAYNAAAEMDYNERIKEDALFSYAKLTYELSYSPFNETINAFDRYISLYPNSERNAEAYRILVEVYMVTKNYKDAIASIEKIENKTPAILKAYQRVTFYRGLELFNNLSYNAAIEYFDLSMENGSQNRELNARALYWKAEALYRVGDYNSSIDAYNRFLRTAGSYTLSEFNNAEYNLAYAYLKLDDNGSAFSHFRKYVNAMEGKRTPKLADALNRMGDHYFLQTDYARAIQSYQQSYNLKVFESDYALLQIAFCQGLQRNQQGKIENLERLLAGFPESDYRDDALYELGRANERIGKSYEATQQYEQIIAEYPHGNYYRKALLQLGLINYNNGDYNKALAQYKEVAENYKGTPEAESALLGIKNCYVEMNNVDAYFAYANRLGAGANVTASEQDSLTYQAAERLYMNGKEGAAEQLERYLNQFPNGSFTLNAHFYLAEVLYKEGQYEKANTHYTHVAMLPDNIFSEPALSRASEMTFNAEKYNESLEMFNRLELMANSKWNILKANTGQLRCNLILENYPEVLKAARKVKKSDVASDALKREADYAEGKANYVLNNLNASIAPLRSIAADTKLEQGAEAKYLLAEIYYRQDKKQQAEQEIIDFIDKGTPYTYWLGKAFLLLANIYSDNGDQFQAKHTLKSLAENYNDDNDGIKEEARKRLGEIEALEAAQQKNAIDSSFQIEIKQN